jgi:hypothetical protein
MQQQPAIGTNGRAAVRSKKRAKRRTPVQMAQGLPATATQQPIARVVRDPVIALMEGTDAGLAKLAPQQRIAFDAWYRAKPSLLKAAA